MRVLLGFVMFRSTSVTRAERASGGGHGPIGSGINLGPKAGLWGWGAACILGGCLTYFTFPINYEKESLNNLTTPHSSSHHQ